jgi:hypothetical protein
VCLAHLQCRRGRVGQGIGNCRRDLEEGCDWAIGFVLEWKSRDGPSLHQIFDGFEVQKFESSSLAVVRYVLFHSILCPSPVLHMMGEEAMGCFVILICEIPDV